MASVSSPTAAVRHGLAEVVRGCIEVLVLALVCVSPWVLGSVEPGAEFCLYGGVALLLLLWAVRALLEGVLTWKHCPVSLGLAGLFLFGVWQLVPWPAALLPWLSPNTARLTHELLPVTPEILPGGEVVHRGPLDAGAALSLYPAETRLALVRLLAVLSLFAVVRNNLGSLASLRRLALAALVNGFLLAFFAVVQFFSSRPATIYWTLPVLNNPFGPFICKNHFPFYLNLCIGLGVGLLLSLGQPGRKGAGRPDRSALFNWQGLLNAPGALWIAVALAFMASSVALSLSRGGLISLAGAAAICLLLRFVQAQRVSRWGTGLFIGTLALALAVWFGVGPLEARLATVWQGDALEDARVPMWWDVLPAVQRFPLWGTGYGTFLYVELMLRTRPEAVHEGWENAHNDYLEALIEGGVVRLVLSLLVIALVYRLSWRALRRWEGRPGQALIGGALFAFTTVVLHSFVDFGLHIPAIAVLTTVIVAHLSALGAAPEKKGDGNESCADAAEEGTGALRLGGLAPVAGLGVALLLGGILYGEGWRLARTYSLEVAAREREDKPERSQRERRLALLDAAARVSPDSAHVHLVAGQAYLDSYQREVAEGEKCAAVCAAARSVVAVVPTFALTPFQAVQLGVTARPPTPSPTHFEPQGEQGEWAHRYLTPALRHYLQARNLCPLIAKPHVQIAAHLEGLEQADPRDVYLRRAELACPCHPEIWYLAGILELADGEPEQAWASWRRSLELSSQFLQPILERSRHLLDDRALAEHVLPARAPMLVTAALYLYPQAHAEQRRPYLQRARALLENHSAPLDAADLHLRAQIAADLEDPAAALASYEAALRRDPQQTTWRLEYASLLHQQGQQAEARRELRLVLGQQPENSAAKELLERVARALAEGK